MKAILIFVAILFLAIGCNNSNEFKNDLERRNLKGKVKTLKWTPYEAVEKFGEVTKGKNSTGWFTKSYFDTYNEIGKRIERQDLRSSGDLSKKTVYKYNTLNKIEEVNTYNSAGKLDKKTKYTYDENGNQIAKTEYDSDGILISKEVYEYYENGNQKEVQYINSHGEEDEKTIFKNDSKNNLIDLSSYDLTGNLIKRMVSEYNDQGDLIEVKHFNSDKKIEQRIVLDFDDNSNHAKLKVYYSAGDSTIITDYYFISDFYYKQMKNGDFSLFNLGNEERDVSKILIKFVNDGIEVQATYDYKYDKRGNWIERIEYENNVPREFVEREITYY